mmetsp:Transcript_1390/g.2920  ORF Transcript_1390/g.2920 Transcript_1390/m.2920 type:complete len:246 (-) Transcript_1390:1647-2384(-)
MSAAEVRVAPRCPVRVASATDCTYYNARCGRGCGNACPQQRASPSKWRWLAAHQPTIERSMGALGNERRPRQCVARERRSACAANARAKQLPCECCLGLLRLRNHLEEMLHLVDLQVLVRLVRVRLLCAFDALPQVRRKLQRVDAAPVVADDEDGLDGIESDMRELGAFDHLLLADALLAVHGKVVDVNDAAHWSRRTIRGNGGKRRRRVRRPSDVTDGLAQIEGHDRQPDRVVPHFHGPVGRRR